MILTLLSMLGGGFLRMLPEVIGLWNKKTDNAHELAMMDKQLELQKSKAADDRATLEVQGNIQEIVGLLDAQKEALKGQMQPTGIRLVDALNWLVRPLTTYYFLILYGLVKASMLMVALNTPGLDTWHAIIQCWSADDAQTLSGILAFWFVGRVFDKKQA